MINTNTLILPAPAKLNLFLHIIARRDDGYHDLQTVFQFLDYSDEIQLELRQDNTIHRLNSTANIPLESDLCMRAAHLLQKHCRTDKGVNISLNKKLPIGGGIGGGSSDAATVLQGLNHLWGCNLNDHELAKLGLQLGADVHVFIHGYAAWAEGVGEQLTPIEPEEKWFLVIRPDVSVSTAEIFADQALTRDCEALTITRFLKCTGDREFSNIFEPVVKRKYPQIADAIEWLSSFSCASSPARLTGTGSCIFAPFKDKKDATKVLKELQSLPNKWQGFVAKGLNQSPLKNALQNS